MKRVLSLALLALLIFQIAPAEARTLKLSHSEALQMQMRLNKLGFYTGPMDGIVGPLTKQALCDFQRLNGIYMDGKATPATRAALAITAHEHAIDIGATLPLNGGGGFARPIAYFANPWVDKPQYLYAHQ